MFARGTDGLDHIHIHKYIFIYIHAYLHTYIYTYIPTYSHIGPSMASRSNDPEIALFASGKDGLDAYRALAGRVGGVGAVVKEGGSVIVEVPHDAARRCFVQELGDGWVEVKSLFGPNGCIRGVVLRKCTL